MRQNRGNIWQKCLVAALYGTKQEKQMAEMSRSSVLWDKAGKQLAEMSRSSAV